MTSCEKIFVLGLIRKVKFKRQTTKQKKVVILYCNNFFVFESTIVTMQNTINQLPPYEKIIATTRRKKMKICNCLFLIFTFQKYKIYHEKKEIKMEKLKHQYESILRITNFTQLFSFVSLRWLNNQTFDT